MQKLLILFAALVFFSGCAGTSGILGNDEAMLTAIELGGYNAGYYVGKSKTTDDDVAIATAYKLAREGKLSPQEVGVAMAKLKIDNPQLAGSLLIMLKNMGAQIDPASGGLLGLTGIPLAYWDRAAAGYITGYEIGKAGQKSRARQIA